MRRMRVEVAVVALMLAPLLGYAVGYFAAGGASPAMRVGMAAVSELPAAPRANGKRGT